MLRPLQAESFGRRISGEGCVIMCCVHLKHTFEILILMVMVVYFGGDEPALARGIPTKIFKYSKTDFTDVLDHWKYL